MLVRQNLSVCLVVNTFDLGLERMDAMMRIVEWFEN